ncbi:MAG: DUF2157 domain-containing protein [Spirochaetales bacterium]|nr:DUF2157 domain-containing protein [Spirochaetales bacterium]
MKDKQRKWFFAELKKLEKDGVLKTEALNDIYDYYGVVETQKDNKARIMIVFGILGGLLIGSGIILLLAHNWSSLNRLVQSSLFLGPLLALQIISAMFIIKGRVKDIWFETIGIIYYLMIGAAIAMIDRIYHLGGELDTFLLIWAAGGLPVCYFLKSDVSSILYIFTIVSWAVMAQNNGGNAVLFWPLFAAVIPRLFLSFKRNRNVYHRGLIEFLVIATLIVSLGITLEKVLPGLWILIYSCFFIMLYLSGDLSSYGLRLNRGVGLLGMSILTVLFTMREFWDGVGFSTIRVANRFHPLAAVSDYVILGVLILLIFYLILSRKVKLTFVNLLFISMLIPVAAGFLYPQYGPALFHFFTLFLGFFLTIDRVIKNEHWMLPNIGLLVIFTSMLVHLGIYNGFSFYWIFLYSCFLIVIFIKSGFFRDRLDSASDKFWEMVCLLTGLGLIYGLSFTRYNLGRFPDNMVYSPWFLFPLIISAGAMLYHLIPYFKVDRKIFTIISIFPVIALIFFLIGAGGTLLYNLYLLGIGISLILKGINSRSIKIANGGILITLTLIVTRFFDVDMSFSERGVVFILLGLFFLVFNIYFSKKLRGEEQK